MLSRRYTLKGKENFVKLQKSGRIYQSQLFGLGVLARGDNNDSQFGFIVSKKISKKAVDRNRIRRILAEQVRKMIGEIKSGYDVAFLAKAGCLEKKPEELTEEVRKAILAANLFIQ